jgi:hypothetical protein
LHFIQSGLSRIGTRRAGNRPLDGGTLTPAHQHPPAPASAFGCVSRACRHRRAAAPEWCRDALKTINALEYEPECR